MTVRIVAATLAVCLLLRPAPCMAQSDVTFKLPLNLSQLAPDIAKVAVLCVVTSSALTTTATSPIVIGPTASTSPNSSIGVQEWPATSGQVVTTATVVVPVPASSLVVDAVGKTAGYTCLLVGFSTSLQRWNIFTQDNTIAAFRISPLPPPFQGAFVW